MIDFMKLLGLVYIADFQCEITSERDRIKFTWRGYDHVVGAPVSISRIVSNVMLTQATVPEDVIRCLVKDARKGLEKMQ